MKSSSASCSSERFLLTAERGGGQRSAGRVTRRRVRGVIDQIGAWCHGASPWGRGPFWASCRWPARCHTYDAVGYARVGKVSPYPPQHHIPVLDPRPHRGRPMTPSPDLIDDAPDASSSDSTGAPLPSATLGGEQKRSLEQIALLIFIIVPFVALVAAVPLAWGWGMSWLDLGLMVGMYYIGCHGITIGFHRYFTHGAFKAKRPLRIALAIAGLAGRRGPARALGGRPPQAPQVLRRRGRPALAVALRRDRARADEGPVVGAHRLDVRRGADPAAEVRARPGQGPGHQARSPASSCCGRSSRWRSRRWSAAW